MGQLFPLYYLPVSTTKIFVCLAPKKAQKMSLNEFLGDSSQQTQILLSTWNFKSDPPSALGSWADEMDSLPTARMFSYAPV